MTFVCVSLEYRVLLQYIVVYFCLCPASISIFSIIPFSLFANQNFLFFYHHNLQLKFRSPEQEILLQPEVLSYDRYEDIQKNISAANVLGIQSSISATSKIIQHQQLEYILCTAPTWDRQNVVCFVGFSTTFCLIFIYDICIAFGGQARATWRWVPVWGISKFQRYDQ